MIGGLDKTSAVLLDSFQHSFPLVPAPFALAGEAAETDGAAAIRHYRKMMDDGLITRIGAVVAPNAVSVSTLAAIAVPQADLERVAQVVSAETGVNHNYERENTVNLWFVVAAPCEGVLLATLERIARRTGLKVLDLRLEEPFHLDLGFSLSGEAGRRRRLAKPDVSAIDGDDRLLLAAIADGIPLVERPYRQIGEAIGWSEEAVLARLAALVAANVIRRFGVEHRKALEISAGPRLSLFGLAVGSRPSFKAMAAPTTLVVDEAGVIRWIDQTDDYKVRSSAERVLGAVGEAFGGPRVVAAEPETGSALPELCCPTC